MKRAAATAVGFSAVVMWASLALFTIGTAPVPPFQLSAMCFAIGGAIGLVWTARGAGLGALRQVSRRVYAFGTLGLFGYHALYFTAFRLAPSAETGLIAYLWPLFIVLFSGLLPGERLGALHVFGAGVAFAGAALLILGQSGASFAIPHAGAVLALACAVIWAAYSVLTRRMGEVPTEAVTVYCLATAALSLVVHLAVEQTAWPAHASGWAAILALGLLPVGAAFFVWDVGMKRGDIQLLGVASYAAPLLSTLALIGAGITPFSPRIALAAGMITLGAALAAWASARSVNRG